MDEMMELLSSTIQVTLNYICNLYYIEGRCEALLGKIALYSDYIDKEDKKKGFFVYYTGGDFCGGDFSLERKTKFVFNCD